MTRLLISLALAAAFAGFSSEAGAQSLVPPQKSRLELPRQYRPPPGMCRIWLDSVPPNRQPAPTDCATAIRNLPPNARIVFSDSLSQRERDEKGKEKDKPRKPDTTSVR